MKLIFHITGRSHWQQAQQMGIYQSDSLETEGFIHCSTFEQVVCTADAFFLGQAGLVLLGIDPTRLQAELRYDKIETGELFPHLYGPLNLDAVVQVSEFEPNAQGRFSFPADYPIG